MTLGLLTVLGAGILTFATPCVLPVIPIYLAALVGGNVSEIASVSRGRLLGRAGLFAVGFLAVFVAMGVGASGLGALIASHRAVIQAAGAGIVLLLALKMLGVIQIPWLDRTIRADDGRWQGRLGGFYPVLMGVLFAAGWSPCVGPVLGSVLTYTASTTSSPAMGAIYLGTYGLGFALPLLLVASFAPTGLRLLAKIRPALPRLEKATGVLLIGVAALLAHDAASGWPSANAASPVAATASDVDVGSPQSAGPSAARSDGSALDATDSLGAPEGEPGRPSMVELYAENCPVCQRMKPLVQSLSSQCEENGVRVGAIDVSKPENRSLASRFRVVGVPTFIFLDERGSEVARLVGEQPESTLRQALSALRGEPCPGVGSVTTPPASTPSGSCAVELSSVASSDEDAERTARAPGVLAGDAAASCGPGTI
jgi:cytochrome c-type biogenesis protein